VRVGKKNKGDGLPDEERRKFLATDPIALADISSGKVDAK
jgi:hypothetical protein